MANPPFKCTGSSTLSTVCNRKRKEVLVTPFHDEQLQFTTADDVVLSNMNYMLSLADGSIVTGVTDDKGRTKRIRTPAPVEIETAKLNVVDPKASGNAATSPSVQTAHSCTMHSLWRPDFLVMELNGVKTNAVRVGTSVAAVVTPRNSSRSLTQGEIEIATQLYKDAVDYTRVKVHNGYYFWPFQGKNTAVTPLGSISFPPGRYKEDFSRGSNLERHWFIHEMAHVWQYQNGYNVLGRGIQFLRELSYKYVLDEKNTLCNYNMEAQSDLLADYWSLVDGRKRALADKDIYMEMKSNLNNLELYKKVLRKFFEDPSSSENLPHMSL